MRALRANNMVTDAGWQIKLGRELPAFFHAGYLLGLVVIALAILLPDFPPLQDFWEWVYQSVVAERMLKDGAEGSAFVFHNYPVPNALSQFALTGMALFLPAPWAAKVLVMAYLALTLLVYRALRKLGPVANAAPTMLIIFSILFGSQFFNGYINNLFGNVILLLFFVTTLRRPPTLTETFAFSILLFFCHATSYTVFGLLMVLYVLWGRVRWVHLAALVPSGLLFLWYLARKDTLVDDGLVLEGVKDWVFYKAYSVAKLGPYHNFWFGGEGDLQRAPALFWSGVVVNLVFATMLAALIAHVFLLKRFSWVRDPGFVCVALLLLAFPLMPNSVSGVVNIGERYLTIAILLLLPLAVIGPVKRTLSVGAVLALVLLPVTARFTADALRYQESPSLMVIDYRIDEDDRMSKLFWHRPFQGVHLAPVMQAVAKEGLDAAVPLGFRTSLIGPRAEASTAEPEKRLSGDERVGESP